MDVPRDLDGWTVEVIEALALAGQGEDERFDFKSASMARNPNVGEQLSKAVAAFANSRGGFLVFGVEEPQKGQAAWITKPVQRTKEFAQLFSQKIRVEPPVRFPPPREVLAPGGEAFYVVHIPASADGPHASVAAGGRIFYHRTHEGSVPMSYNHIKEALVGAETRRVTARVLVHELQEALKLAEIHRMAGLENAEDLETTGFELAGIRESMARLHNVLAREPSALENLADAIRAMQRVNGTLNLAVLQMGSLGTDVRRVWGRRVNQRGDTAVQALHRAIDSVTKACGLGGTASP
jgi:hypothetical protein